MWSFISRLVLRLAALRWLFKLGGLGLLLPIALVLKAIGLPVLIVLMVLALPVLALLFLFGLPIFLVLLAGGAVMGLLGMVMTLSLVALKIALFVVLPAWAIWKLGSMLFCRRKGNGPDDSGASTGGSSDVPPPDTAASTSEPTIDPLVDPLD